MDSGCIGGEGDSSSLMVVMMGCSEGCSSSSSSTAAGYCCVLLPVWFWLPLMMIHRETLDATACR